MLNLPNISTPEFLEHYWQKKPLLIPKALPGFKNLLSPDELAGLAMEEEIESRLVIQNIKQAKPWTLKRGPFKEKDFKKLPPSHWTLLVQAVDRFIPEVNILWDHFDFIPQWRLDDIMISYAVEQGSVGPHYDHYDVFLYQAQGRRKWLLTATDCVESNYLQDVELRIMKEFKVEQEYLLEEGDMLYLPAHIGHHGISLSQDCMTYSFGYRSYRVGELWDSFGDYVSSKTKTPLLYRDPSWSQLKKTSELTASSCNEARRLMQSLLEDNNLLQDWWGHFVTSLDNHAENLLPEISEEEEFIAPCQFKQELVDSKGLVRAPICRLAYSRLDNTEQVILYINGEKWSTDEVTEALIEQVGNNRTLPLAEILPFLKKDKDVSFLYDLWISEILEFWD